MTGPQRLLYESCKVSGQVTLTDEYFKAIFPENGQEQDQVVNTFLIEVQQLLDGRKLIWKKPMTFEIAD